MKELSTKIALAVVSSLGLFFVWVTVSIYSIQAKADRVIAVEEKLDYIYKYVLEHSQK